MTLQEILARRPADLGDGHVALAEALLRWPEGLTRQQGAQQLNTSDREFRRLVESAVASGWLPIIPDRGTTGQEEARYRIARADEVELLNAQVSELKARAIASHERARGLRDAFLAHHSAGALFTPDVEPLSGWGEAT